MARRTFQEKIDFILAAHGNQCYGGTKTDDGGMDGFHPVSFHLFNVKNRLANYGFADEETAIICIGHDVIEDTSLTFKQLVDFGFTWREAWGIFACTDGQAKTRKERKAMAYVKLNGVGALGKGPKIGDRYENVLHSLETGYIRKFEMYCKEQIDFEGTLRNPEGEPQLEPMWIDLSYLFTAEAKERFWATKQCCGTF